VGKTLFAAPFDWRTPSTSQAEFFAKLQKLVETVSKQHGGTKVSLWAFSFGPQYALSFLHRMSQSWKDQYIDSFVASSPVWSGAPAALASFVNGNVSFAGQPPPDLPKQCKPFEVVTDTCFTGVPTSTHVNFTAADCCAASAQSDSKMFNYFAANSTCFQLGGYIATEPCAGGFLGYMKQQQRAHAAQAAQSTGVQRGSATPPNVASLVPRRQPHPLHHVVPSRATLAPSKLQGGDAPAPITPALVALLGRSCPALMWAWSVAHLNS
jgi:hypothetical protein